MPSLAQLATMSAVVVSGPPRTSPMVPPLASNALISVIRCAGTGCVAGAAALVAAAELVCGVSASKRAGILSYPAQGLPLLFVSGLGSGALATGASTSSLVSAGMPAMAVFAGGKWIVMTFSFRAWLFPIGGRRRDPTRG